MFNWIEIFFYFWIFVNVYSKKKLNMFIDQWKLQWILLFSWEISSLPMDQNLIVIINSIRYRLPQNKLLYWKWVFSILFDKNLHLNQFVGRVSIYWNNTLGYYNVKLNKIEFKLIGFISIDSRRVVDLTHSSKQNSSVQIESSLNSQTRVKNHRLSHSHTIRFDMTGKCDDCCAQFHWQLEVFFLALWRCLTCKPRQSRAKFEQMKMFC